MQVTAEGKCLCHRKEGLCGWDNQPQRSKVGKSMGKSLAENQEESQGEVGGLGQKSQIPDFFARRARKRKLGFL